MPPETANDLAPRARAEALAEVIEAAALLLAQMVWSPQALPMAERLAAALNRVTERAETNPTCEGLPTGSAGSRPVTEEHHAA